MANPIDSDDEDDGEEEDDDEDDEEEERMFGLPGIPGEAKVTMLGDIMERIEAQRKEDAPQNTELEDEEYQELMEAEEEDEDDEAMVALPVDPPVPRQTFIYSATLTLPSSDAYVSAKKKKRKRNSSQISVDGALAEILEKARAAGKTKVVDLTSSNKRVAKEDKSVELVSKQSNIATKTNGDSSSSSTTNLSSRLPPGLKLEWIECTQRHKDSFLYAYLVTTAQGASGPCLVFCNSIAAVRRVGTTLLTLKLPVRMLHANMPQVSSTFFLSFSRLTPSSYIYSSRSSRLFCYTFAASWGLFCMCVWKDVSKECREEETYLYPEC